jgi:hypothetical protein
MTETTEGRDRRTTDRSHESTWGATEAAKAEWRDAHQPIDTEREELPGQAETVPGPTFENPNEAQK